MICVSPRVLVPLVGALALGSILSACSGSGSDRAVGTSGQSDAFLSVDVSTPQFVTLENRTEQPLIDVNVGIKSGMLTYSGGVSRLEAKEKRQLRHGEFTSRDGTGFSLRVARPTQILVTARDTAGKPFETTIPW
jgi:hypothetical protein